jgi:vancomycin permeability regulator SanA
VGFPAKDVSTFRGLRTRVRESLARVRTLLDVHLLGREPHFLGPPIVIGVRWIDKEVAPQSAGTRLPNVRSELLFCYGQGGHAGQKPATTR